MRGTTSTLARPGLAAALGLAISAQAVFTQAVLAQAPGKDEIVRSLMPPEAPRTRSLMGAAPTRRIEVVPGQQEQVLAETRNLPSINIRVLFDYNSDALTPAGQTALKPLGEALQDPKLQGFRVLIGGHTDAKGSEDYNQSLSERRARSVREALILDYKIAPDRLSSMGFGKRKPADPADPEAAVNRRVEIVNLGQ